MGTLRLLLALAVVIQHTAPLYGYPAIWGVTAVELFFVISGFYMALVLSTKYTAQRTAQPTLNFYKSRFLRLYPTFALLSLGTLGWFGITWIYLGRPPTTALGPLFGLVEFQPALWLACLSNLTMVGQDIPSLFHVNHSTGALMLTLTDGDPLADGSPWFGFVRLIGPAWSIGTEIWFYLMAPWLARCSVKLLFAVLAASLMIKAHLTLNLGLLDYFFFPAQLCFFVLGMLAYKLGRQVRAFRSTPLRYAAPLFLITLILMAGAVHIPYVRPILYVAMTLLIFPTYTLTAAWSFDRLVGELSYPVYMAHSLIALMLNNIFKISQSPHYAAMVIGVSLAVAAGLHYFVERPVDRFRARYAG